MRKRQLMEKMIDFQSGSLGKLARQINLTLGLDIPPSVEYGKDFRIYHRGYGVVVHPNTSIGSGVRIYQGVTIGRGDPYTGRPEAEDLRFVVEDDVWLCAGCVVLGSRGVTRIGKGSVIAANAVLLESTGENEIWAGVPARRVGFRS